MPAIPFTRHLLLLIAGPLVWAVHFLTIYIFVGIVCARPQWNPAWMGISMAGWGTLVATGVALIALAVVFFQSRPQTGAPGDRVFVYRVSVGLILLSLVAIIWETMPVFLVPACA